MKTFSSIARSCAILTYIPGGLSLNRESLTETVRYKVYTFFAHKPPTVESPHRCIELYIYTLDEPQDLPCMCVMYLLH